MYLFMSSHSTKLNNIVVDSLTNQDKTYFNPESNILSADSSVLEDPECMSKWLQFILNKKQKCICEGQNSFDENISVYSWIRSISSLEQLSDWDNELISKLQENGLSVILNEVKRRNLPSDTSVYVTISR